jgi:transposase-like protein
MRTRRRRLSATSDLLIDAARPCRHAVGDRWFVDETCVKVAGVWRYVYRAIDDDGQVIEVYLSRRRYIASDHKFFAVGRTGNRTRSSPTELRHWRT